MSWHLAYCSFYLHLHWNISLNANKAQHFYKNLEIEQVKYNWDKSSDLRCFSVSLKIYSTNNNMNKRNGSIESRSHNFLLLYSFLLSLLCAMLFGALFDETTSEFASILRKSREIRKSPNKNHKNIYIISR